MPINFVFYCFKDLKSDTPQKYICKLDTIFVEVQPNTRPLGSKRKTASNDSPCASCAKIQNEIILGDQILLKIYCSRLINQRRKGTIRKPRYRKIDFVRIIEMVY